jgi:hypothetical protein
VSFPPRRAHRLIYQAKTIGAVSERLVRSDLPITVDAVAVNLLSAAIVSYVT